MSSIYLGFSGALRGGGYDFMLKSTTWQTQYVSIKPLTVLLQSLGPEINPNTTKHSNNNYRKRVNPGEVELVTFWASEN